MPARSRPTILDVARSAGVSPTTVSYVLSGPKERASRISDDTAKRVRAAVAELGYVANQSARSLRLRRSNRILFLGNRFTSLFSQSMATSIESRINQHGLSLDVLIGAGSDQVRRAIQALNQHAADGLIVETAGGDLDDLREAAAAGHAIVAVGPIEAEPLFDVVSNDDVPAIRAAMSHVVHRGVRHVVLLAAQPGLDDHRVLVARDHLVSLGLPDDHLTTLHCPHDRIAACDAAKRFLPAAPSPVGVYAGSDVSAFGVLWACYARGLRVPDDVAIVGHGNSPETGISVPTLTSLGPISHDFGKAADLMVSRLAQRDLPGRCIVEPYRLFVRDSA